MSLYLGNNLVSGVATPTEPTRNLGQIIESLVPQTDAGLHLLDGSLINGSGIYSAFVTHIAGLVSTYPNLFVTESDWQTAVTTYGVCGKFVYDSVNNTVRLPKVTGIIEGTTDVTALGDLVEAGLPSIEHTHTSYYKDPNSSSGSNNGVGSGSWFNFSSRETSINTAVNSIYGKSDTVQPQTIKAFYYIVIATTTKTEIEVDIDEVATDLNGKADTDLSNVPTSKGILSESYVNGTSWYRVYSDGWCEQGGLVSSNTTTANFNISFIKSYINTNITIFTTSTQNNTYSSNTGNASVNACEARSACTNSITTTGFNLNYMGSDRQIMWQACGYIR